MKKPEITFHVVTLFPDSLGSYLNESILKRAQEDGIIKMRFYNPRDFAVPTGNSMAKKNRIKHPQTMTYAERRVDDKPYGGGPGMVIEALPVIRAIEAALKNCKKGTSKKNKKSKETSQQIKQKEVTRQLKILKQQIQ